MWGFAFDVGCVMGCVFTFCFGLVRLYLVYVEFMVLFWICCVGIMCFA